MGPYKTVQTYSIPEFESFVKDANLAWHGHANKKGRAIQLPENQINLCGHRVHTLSLRYKTFLEKGYKCVCCGREGSIISLDETSPSRAHFNLYSEDGVLITKDHIVPASKGGENWIENMQTMCVICNNKKGANDESNGIEETEKTEVSV